MARPKMRPSFRVKAACTAEEMRSTIIRQLDLQAGHVEGGLSGRHGVLQIPVDERRFFTPCLELTIDEGDEERAENDHANTNLWGTFSPRAEIWTAFVFSIGTLTILGIFSSIYGIAQLVLGRLPFGLLVALAAVLLSALLYVSALVGQGMSISQMYLLRAFVDDCLREAETDEAHKGIDAPNNDQIRSSQYSSDHRVDTPANNGG